MLPGTSRQSIESVSCVAQLLLDTQEEEIQCFTSFSLFSAISKCGCVFTCVCAPCGMRGFVGLIRSRSRRCIIAKSEVGTAH